MGPYKHTLLLTMPGGNSGRGKKLPTLAKLSSAVSGCSREAALDPHGVKTFSGARSESPAAQEFSAGNTTGMEKLQITGEVSKQQNLPLKSIWSAKAMCKLIRTS